jgi:microcystin-dependent protein
LAEIKLVSFNFAPKGWAQCDGQILPINQNQALFSLMGTTYGGDGRVSFGLPDLRGRMAMHWGNGFTQGQRGGQEAHTITQAEMPGHNHSVNASMASTATGPSMTISAAPSGNMLARSTTQVYSNASPDTTLLPETITNVGGSQPHLNIQPVLALMFVVALQGIFPSQN